ncbi:integrin beta-nu-like [Photinus pyralis]|uniref:integrin beta-nu-like n=1 Tax=Photinus pyralis TaxID=7054 RepID=UPI0012670AE9|nr:integrin beta-nu-like [Photinus pyralis]
MRSTFVCYFCILFKITMSALTPQERLCQNFGSCDLCIQAETYCGWCFQENFKSDRCGPLESLVRDGCDKSNILQSSEDSKILDMENKDFRGVTNPDNIEDSIQLKPQKVSVQIKAKQPINFQFVYRPAEDYPLDLYYLMDLTETMYKDIATMATLGADLTKLLQQLSKNFRVAFGYYSDKVAFPFSRMAPHFLENPCEPYGQTCEKPFNFVHKLNFTNDVEKFVNTVNASKTTSNLDNLEGGMDALLQIIYCEDYIKWRKNSRKLIVIATTASMHFAGDGIFWLGAVKRITGKCFLDQKTVSTAARWLRLPIFGRGLSPVGVSTSVNLPNFRGDCEMWNVYFAMKEYTGSLKLEEVIDG